MSPLATWRDAVSVVQLAPLQIRRRFFRIILSSIGMKEHSLLRRERGHNSFRKQGPIIRSTYQCLVCFEVSFFTE